MRNINHWIVNSSFHKCICKSQIKKGENSKIISNLKNVKFLPSSWVVLCSFAQVSDNCSRLHCVLYFHRRLKLVLWFDKCALTRILTFADEILTNRMERCISFVKEFECMRHDQQQNTCHITLNFFFIFSFCSHQYSTGDLLLVLACSENIYCK